MDELKPCPFCGAEATIICDNDDGISRYNKVRCTVCYAQSGTRYYSREDAIEAWNTRHQDNQTIALQSRAITEWQDKCMLLETELHRLQEQVTGPSRFTGG